MGAHHPSGSLKAPGAQERVRVVSNTMRHIHSIWPHPHGTDLNLLKARLIIIPNAISKTSTAETMFFFPQPPRLPIPSIMHEGRPRHGGERSANSVSHSLQGSPHRAIEDRPLDNSKMTDVGCRLAPACSGRKNSVSLLADPVDPVSTRPAQRPATHRTTWLVDRASPRRPFSFITPHGHSLVASNPSHFPMASVSR